MALQIVAFKWGNRYTMAHVNKLHAMLRRNLTISWEFVLISDDPADASGFEPLPNLSVFPNRRWLPLWSEMRSAKLCGVRLRAFGADMAERIGPRFAWIDMDVVITGNVDHIFSRPEPFIALATPQGPLLFNGSLVMMNAGARREVFERWTAERYAMLPEFYASRGMKAGGESDEGWMTYVMMGGPIPPRFNASSSKPVSVSRKDGIYYFRKDLNAGRLPLPADARMVIMNGRAFDPSNAAAQALPWVRQHWR